VKLCGKDELVMDVLDTMFTGELLNVNVPYVLAALREVARDDSHLGQCRDCLIDVAARALNSLAPRYFGGGFRSMPPGVRGMAHSEVDMEEKLRKDAEKAVAEAVAAVSENPHH
jgi:hypothetical protein